MGRLIWNHVIRLILRMPTPMRKKMVYCIWRPVPRMGLMSRNYLWRLVRNCPRIRLSRSERLFRFNPLRKHLETVVDLCTNSLLFIVLDFGIFIYYYYYSIEKILGNVVV